MPKKLARWVLFNLLFCGGLIALSGEWTSPLLWTYLAGVSAVFLYALTSIDEDLAKERFHPPQRSADATALHWIRATAIAALLATPLALGCHWAAPGDARLRRGV